MALALDATVIHTALTRFALGTLGASTVIMGNVVHAGNKMNPTRQVAVAGGMEDVDLAPYLQRDAYWTARSQQCFAAAQSASGQVP